MMVSETVRVYCMARAGTTEEYHFGPDAMVFKVLGKIFALISLDENPLRINLKCDPAQAPVLRAMHESIQPGYHMNKEHWNTIVLDGSLPEQLIRQLIDESYDLVVAGLPRAKREGLRKKL